MSTPTDLPEHVHLTTPTESFTSRRLLALRDGRFWEKPLAGFGERQQGWRPFGERRPCCNPTLVEFSADENNIVAVDAEGKAYDIDLTRGRELQRACWGVPWWARPLGPTGPLALPSDRVAWAMTDSGKDVRGYSDVDGNFHGGGFGCSHIYILDRGGRRLRYGDRWLRPRGPDGPTLDATEIGLPERGRFIPVALSGSASTIVVMNACGEMYTRFAETDSFGANPALPFSYVRKMGRWDWTFARRTLPGEEWRRQEPIHALGEGPPAALTTAIVIRQTGVGNAARELRVEGVNGHGHVGYYRKTLYGRAWTFVRTDAALVGRPIDPRQPPERGPARDFDYCGRMLGAQRLPVTLHGFNMVVTGAHLRFQVGELPIELTFHHHHVLPWFTRHRDHTKAALVLPEALVGISSFELCQVLDPIFGEGRVCRLSVEMQGGAPENGAPERLVLRSRDAGVLFDLRRA